MLGLCLARDHALLMMTRPCFVERSALDAGTTLVHWIPGVEQVDGGATVSLRWRLVLTRRPRACAELGIRLDLHRHAGAKAERARHGRVRPVLRGLRTSDDFVRRPEREARLGRNLPHRLGVVVRTGQTSRQWAQFSIAPAD